MKKYLLPLIFILLLIFVSIGNCAWLSGYDQRIKLTIDNTKIDAALSDFPVTVFFTPVQAEEIFTEFDADSDYMKCAFTSSDGTTQLYAEKELFGFISQYPPTQSDTYVKSTTKTSTSYWAYYATDPAKSLTGSQISNSWRSTFGSNTNQRFHIDLGSAKIVKKIYYENHHNSGAETDMGCQNFTFWGSNTGAGTFDDLVYANDEGWTQLTISQSTFDQHTAANVADPKYIMVTNTTAYRYYAFKFADNYTDANYMGVRRIELQTGEAIYHVKVTSVASGADTDIYYYYDNDHADNTTYIGAINTTAGATVWDNDFKLVCHMVDATTSTVVDSTSNNNDGTKKAANEPVEVAGKVHKAQDYDGGDDWIGFGDAFYSDTLTIEHIITIDANKLHGLSNKRNAAGTVTNADEEWAFFVITDVLYFYVGAYIANSTGTLTTGTPAYCVAVAEGNGNNVRTYLNGSPDGVGAQDGAIPNTNSGLQFGSRTADNNARYFDGEMDESRISSIARSAAWIKATYNSLWDTLLTYGSEEASAEEDNAIFFGMAF